MELSEDVTIYVLDSHRPVNLRNAFWNNEIIVFHDSDLDKDLAQEKDAIIFTEVCVSQAPVWLWCLTPTWRLALFRPHPNCA